MARYWTKEEMTRGWLVAAPGERVEAPTGGLHPEADARLAAATGGGPIDPNAIVRHHAENQVHRIEARVEHGPTFGLIGTLAEIDARLRSGFIGVDVVTGETGKASDWPMVALRMREEWAQMMERKRAGATGGAPMQGRIKSVSVVGPSGTETQLLDGATLRPGDAVTAERDNEGKWAARVVPDDSVPHFRDVADGEQLPTREPIALLEWLCPNIGRERARRIAPLCYGMQIGRPLLALIAKHWHEPTPAKPAVLAAGQVWQINNEPPITLLERSDDPEKWEIQWIDDRREWNRGQILGYKLCDAFGARYLGTLAPGHVWDVNGTRYDLLASEGVEWSAERTDTKGQRKTVSVGVPRLLDHGRYLGAREEIAAREREAHPLRLVVGATPPSDSSLRARCATLAGYYGTRKWLTAVLSDLLSVNPGAIILDDSEPGVVKVSSVNNAIPMSKLAEACDAAQAEMVIGGPALVAAHRPTPIAALRAEIDRLIADDSGPFAHARAAALRSLAEPDGNHVAPLEMPAVVMAMLRAYEDEHGGGRVPSRAARSGPRGSATTERAISVYERERSRSAVHGRRRSCP